MFSMDLGSHQRGGYVVALHGELDIVDAAHVAAALGTIAAREPRIILDLAGLEFIDSSGVAALTSASEYFRRAGGDLLLAAPQQRVLRVIAITCRADDLSVLASVEEAVASASRPRRVVVPMRRPGRTRWQRIAMIASAPE
jgi:anti-sigma B factor antagonist